MTSETIDYSAEYLRMYREAATSAAYHEAQCETARAMQRAISDVNLAISTAGQFWELAARMAASVPCGMKPE